MFTGIVQAVVPVISVVPKKDGLQVRFKKPLRFKMKKGDSILVDGVCSTVVSFGTAFFEVFYMPETMAKTNAGALKKGQTVNIESSLRMGQTIDGHFVQGHVDKTEKILSMKKGAKRCEMRITLSPFLRPFVSLHGSLTVNGVSLTVADVSRTQCMIALIPFTLEHTNLASLEKGDSVNIEVDSLARIVVAALENTSVTSKR